MKCPACGQPLIVVERDGIEVDWCASPQCRGLWFDAGELDLLAEEAGHDISPESLAHPAPDVRERPRRCPRCRKRMEKARVGAPGDEAVIVDRCRAHGVWLDAGELGAVMRLLGEADKGARVSSFLGESFAHAASRTSGEHS